MNSKSRSSTGQRDSFYSRWSRRKHNLRAQEAATPEDEPAAMPPAQRVQSEPPSRQPDLPAVDALDESSDYSGFLSSEVDEGLRRLALRKLFHAAKFNVTDGLDDYAEDFTKFEPLGDIVTADMRHQIEERARRLEQRLAGKDADASRDAAAADPGDAAADRDGTTPAAASSAEAANDDNPGTPAPPDGDHKHNA